MPLVNFGNLRSQELINRRKAIFSEMTVICNISTQRILKGLISERKLDQLIRCPDTSEKRI